MVRLCAFIALSRQIWICGVGKLINWWLLIITTLLYLLADVVFWSRFLSIEKQLFNR